MSNYKVEIYDIWISEMGTGQSDENGFLPCPGK
jgi:hypothetical protein